MSGRRLASSLAATLLAGQLLLTSFRRGWTQVETDFPNYYTAAVLTLRHEPLRSFYDWTWFQRQINYAGTERQLGGYPPQTPLTMLPLLPLACFEPQRAKQAWLALDILFLALSVWMLARLTGLHASEALLIALLARGALGANLVLGQYYIFLSLLLTAAAWSLLRGRHFTAGAWLGLIFALKLYGAPFLFYFAARRQWRACWGMLASMAALTCAAVAIFGWDAIWFFATGIFTRAVDGLTNDPYNPGLGSMTALLRRVLMPEPELNPNPAFDAPGLFFFLRAFYALGVLAVSVLALRAGAWEERRAFAWFTIAVFALSPNTASYHFILLFVPVALLLPGASVRWSAGLLALYAAIALPLRPAYAWLFPKAWLLLALLAYVGHRQLRQIPAAPALAALALALGVSGADAWRRSNAYREEPPRAARLAAPEPGNIFSSAPSLGGGNMFYQAIAQERFVLRAYGEGAIRTFAFEGHALHPAAPREAGPIYFELVARRHSRIVQFDPASGTTEVVAGTDLDAIEPAISPDGATLAFVSRGSLYVRERGRVSQAFASRSVAGPAFFPDGRRIAFAEGLPGSRSIRAIRLPGGPAETLAAAGDSFAPAISNDAARLAYVVSEHGASQIWILNLLSGARWRATSGACNNESPAWRPDSTTIVFASDCDRGLGLPALYSLSVEPARK